MVLHSDSLKYGLSGNELEKVIRLIGQNRKVDKVILFGSRAKGNFQNGSDIDLALKGKNLNLDDILNLSIDFDHLDLPYKYDLVIYDRIKDPALVEHINRVGIVLLDRSSTCNFVLEWIINQYVRLNESRSVIIIIPHFKVML